MILYAQVASDAGARELPACIWTSSKQDEDMTNRSPSTDETAVQDLRSIYSHGGRIRRTFARHARDLRVRPIRNAIYLEPRAHYKYGLRAR